MHNYITERNNMNVTSLIKKWGIPTTRYYQLRCAGIIPAPQSGAMQRKWYSDQEIRDIEKKLKSVGELK